MMGAFTVNMKTVIVVLAVLVVAVSAKRTKISSLRATLEQPFIARVDQIGENDAIEIQGIVNATSNFTITLVEKGGESSHIERVDKNTLKSYNLIGTTETDLKTVTYDGIPSDGSVNIRLEFKKLGKVLINGVAINELTFGRGRVNYKRIKNIEVGGFRLLSAVNAVPKRSPPPKPYNPSRRLN
uniref:DUF2807 domain-containing protein n=1 Tax=Panagrellus redivivus TaxID=6233 RepID=A0A7E4VN84_PANRE